MRELWNRLLDLFRRDRLDTELRDEIAFHQAQLERDRIAAGATEADASSAARRQLGNVTASREAARDRWGFAWLESLQQDLRYTFRGIAKHPGFAFAVILTLGLGIGANAAMFGVIDRLMFRPLPYLRDPASVHRVYMASTYRGKEEWGSGGEYTRYLDLKKWTTSFSQAAGFTSRDLAIGLGDDAREMQVAIVSATFFDFFDARPAVGRWFIPAEDTTPRGALVAVLSYGYWQLAYGGRDDAIGQQIQVGDLNCTIIGVAPKGFVGVGDDKPPAIFIPMTTYAGTRPGDGEQYYLTYNWGWMNMMVRTKPGITAAAADADLTTAYTRSWNAERTIERGLASADVGKPRVAASSMKTGGGPDPSLEARTSLWVTGVAAIVLLIACANVANLFLARALRRRREIAVRLALGVSRARLVAQCLTESLVLSLCGAVVGVLIAQWGGGVLRTMFMRDTAPVSAVTDIRTLAFAIGAAIVVALLTGIVPALAGSRSDLAATLKAGAREGTYQRSRMRSSLLVLQGALSVVLLVGAGLFVRSLENVRAMRVGFEPDPVLMVVGNLRGTTLDSAARVNLAHALLEKAKTIPGVEAATWVSSIPFYSSSSQGLYIPGIDSVRRLGRFTYVNESGDYFKTMGTRIVRGRPLTDDDDRATAPRVAVVSEAMARALWPGREALGQCMKVGADTMPCTTVVGVAETAHQSSLTDDKGFHYYLPMAPNSPTSGFALMLRMRGDAAGQAEFVRKQAQSVMPGHAYLTAQPYRDLVADKRRSWEFGATMFMAFGVLALIVAAFGLYSVISYNVAQRTHELGVRVALGAQARDVAQLVVGEGARLALVGLLVGGVLALTTSKFLAPLLFKVSPRDPLVFGAVAAVLFTVALAASAIPALRASRADPNLALRAD